ncbi:CaiB/BaiF CoA transferase family protein [Streptomyces sp. NPDC058320]|uniref:CaiB/BaiF CoA transferase family protein n=1 Tax=unclassified Streptomyces TaxID=2593676 RepID=UPI00363B0547
MQAQGPLAGYRIVDFGQYVAVPGATQQLAALGADVIKVEPPGGEQSRRIGVYGEAIIRAYSRGKRSVVLDLKTPQGLEVARRLVADADVVCQNARPGVMERLGLGPDDVRAANPRVVYVSVSGFGTRGPSARRAGLDIAAQAESGVMSVTGEPDGDPQRVGFPVVDQATAAVVVQAVLAALLHRERSGRGDEIEVSLLEVAVHLQTPNWTEYGITGVPPARRGNPQPTACPAADVIRTIDGAIVLSAYQSDHFSRLCALIGRPELPEDPRFADNLSRAAHRPALLQELSAALSHLSTEECVTRLSGAGLVAGAIRDYEQVLSSRDVIDNEIFTEGRAVDGKAFIVPALPMRSRTFGRGHGSGRVPGVGEHTDEVLSQLRR